MTEPHYRQGDVLFVKVDEIPRNAREKDDNVIVEGEATGHAHRLTGQAELMFTQNWGQGIDLFINAGPKTEIVHEEHNTVNLPEGLYHVVRQREYNPQTGVRPNFDFVMD